MRPELLITFERGTGKNRYVERLHYGFITVVDEDYKVVFRSGDDENVPFPFRSAAKPLQASVLIDTGTHTHFRLTGEELAIICASHTGSAKHVALIRGILAKAGLSPDDLQCGSHAPLDKEEAQRLIKANEQHTNPHNNCSGKHSGMLLTCSKMDWNINTYLQSDHSLQQAIMHNVKELCILEQLPLTVTDGCSAPIPVLPLKNMGVGYLNLILDDKYRDISLAMTQNPYIAGGKGRLDSEIMNAGGGNLVAKVGADGLCVVMNISERKALVVKMTDADMKARSVVTIESLKQLGWLTESAIASSEGLAALYDKEIKNLRGTTSGEIKAVFELKDCVAVKYP